MNNMMKKWLCLALASMLILGVMAVTGAAETIEDLPISPPQEEIPPVTAAPVQVTPAPEKPVPDPTQVPKQDPTQAPAQDPTQAPTQDPTQAPTQDPTQAPTQDPTQAPTQDPTQAPTEEPTQVPTEEPTPEPTLEPEFNGSVAIEFRDGTPGSFQYGDKVVLDALLIGYEGRQYRITWECSEDGIEWATASGSSHSTSYQFRLNQENAYWSWRVVVDLL